VAYEDVPLPGVTVRLVEADALVASVVTDVNGRYTIDGVPGGYYDIEASLEGMTPSSCEVYINGGTTIADPLSLTIAETVNITLACGSPCGGEGEPGCEEYDSNRELESIAARDTRALEELRSRYRTTSSREERSRIGGFLVSILEDDGEYFAPLAAGAETYLSFAEEAAKNFVVTLPSYVEWCHEKGRDPEKQMWELEDDTMVLLSTTDPRVSRLAYRALHIDISWVVAAGVSYAALTCDPTLLQAVDREFASIHSQVGVSSLLELVPCGDPVLNQRIIALDNGSAAQIVPEMSAWRDAELERLRPPAH
jgi:hypothetical protein